MRRSTLPGRVDESGSALLTVLGTAVVLTLLLLTTLGFALSNLRPTDDDQDAKAALAAAQAGVDDFLSRLNADNNYWLTADPANPAFSAVGAAIPGTGGATGSFRYAVLDTATQVAESSRLRLEVTGKRDRTERSVVATLVPAGFLKYVYYTDVEVTDPALYASSVRVTVNGSSGYSSSTTEGTTTTTTTYTYYANSSTVLRMCSRRYYEARVSDQTYVSSASEPYYVMAVKGGVSTVSTGDVGKTVVLGADPAQPGRGCRELQWVTGDGVDGPMHSNDALYITGSPLFRNPGGPAPGTAWADGSTPAPAANRRWWGAGAPDPAGQSPVVQPLVEMPDSNSAVMDAAQAHGCVYTGATKIVFTEDAMTVLSPGTTAPNKTSCLPAGAAGGTQTVKPIPPVVYVAPTAASCTPGAVGYPLQIAAAGTTPARTESDLGAGPDHACGKGNAYVSGRIRGRSTVAADSDVVVTGDLTYASGTTGSDVLGLIANNYVWVYHPVDAAGDNMLTPAQEVHNIHAAILSVRHSFAVQSWNYGASLGGDVNKLNVVGSISQKFRGPVGTAGGSGYKKNYQYDKRLLALPPPFFLQPKTTPWSVREMSG